MGSKDGSFFQSNDIYNWLLALTNHNPLNQKKMKLSKEQLMGIVRHGLTFVGGLLLMKGLVDEAMVQEITGAVITFVGTIWSVFDKKK